MIDWNFLWNNSRFIDKVLYTINQLLKYSCYIIHTMLLLENSGFAIFIFQTVWVFTKDFDCYGIKSLKYFQS